MAAPLHVAALPQGAAAPTTAAMAMPVVPGVNGATLTRAASNQETYTDLGLMGGEAVTGLLPHFAGPAGAVVSGAFGVAGTQIHNRRNVATLLSVYRDTVAAQMGIPANVVNEADLRFAAEKFPENKVLRAEFAGMDERSVTQPVRKTLSAAAALAGGAVGALAGGGVASLATGFAGSMAAERVANSALDGILGKEETLTPLVALQQAEAKVTAGEEVRDLDMFLFHVAVNKHLADQIEGHMGNRFEELPEEKQTRTMLRDHPLLWALCKYEAALLNSKALPAASLMDERVQAAVKQEFEKTQQPQGRIHTMGSSVSPLAPRPQIAVKTPAAQSGYAQAIEAQRAAAQSAQTQPGLPS